MGTERSTESVITSAYSQPESKPYSSTIPNKISVLELQNV